MSSANKVNFTKKVLVVGNGVAGYFIALRLAERNIPTVLLDAAASGQCATLSNEGWLHRGTYHSVSQSTDHEALLVAERTRRGAETILTRFPECAERTADFSVAVVSKSLDLNLVRARWELSNVRASPLNLSQAADFLPGVSVKSAQALFVVDDQPIHTGRLLAMLRTAFLQHGGKIVRGMATSTDGHDVEIRHSDGTTRMVTPRLTVWSAGYGGVDGVRALLAGQGIEPRLWRSHLLVTETKGGRSWFELHNGGLGLMDHQNHVVIGMNDDVTNLERLREIPEQAVVDAVLRGEALDRFDRGLRRLGLPAVSDMTGAHLTSCTKVDLVAGKNAARDLKLSTLFVSPQMMVAFPGKMTEAPVLAEDVTSQILDAFDAANYPMRVGDWWRLGQTVLAGPSLDKASTAMSRDTVGKTHASSDLANVEARVINDMKRTGLLVPEVLAVSSSVAGATVTQRRMPHEPPGDELMYLEAEVSSIAEFHHTYRVGRSPLSLYRDAAHWNGFIALGRRWDVDFSSSTHLRHMLDDVALLMETVPFDNVSVPSLYRAALEAQEGFGTPTNWFFDGLRSGGVTFAAAVDSVHVAYERIIVSTAETSTWTHADALRGLASISFHELRWEDLPWFRAFRAARVRQYSRLNPGTAGLADPPSVDPARSSQEVAR